MSILNVLAGVLSVIGMYVIGNKVFSIALWIRGVLFSEYYFLKTDEQKDYGLCNSTVSKILVIKNLTSKSKEYKYVGLYNKKDRVIGKIEFKDTIIVPAYKTFIVYPEHLVSPEDFFFYLEEEEIGIYWDKYILVGVNGTKDKEIKTKMFCSTKIAKTFKKYEKVKREERDKSFKYWVTVDKIDNMTKGNKVDVNICKLKKERDKLWNEYTKIGEKKEKYYEEYEKAKRSL